MIVCSDVEAAFWALTFLRVLVVLMFIEAAYRYLKWWPLVPRGDATLKRARLQVMAITISCFALALLAAGQVYFNKPTSLLEYYWRVVVDVGAIVAAFAYLVPALEFDGERSAWRMGLCFLSRGAIAGAVTAILLALGIIGA